MARPESGPARAQSINAICVIMNNFLEGIFGAVIVSMSPERRNPFAVARLRLCWLHHYQLLAI